MGKIKALTVAEEIKKRWQEYTEELYQKKKKNVMTRITMILDKLTNITKLKQTDR